jgi:cyclic beta-1,2-glucan synthetase
MEREAWDGEWYRRATFDDGTWLGSQLSEECAIDSIAQSWAVLSGAAAPERAEAAMASVQKRLILQEDGLALLFAPPFDRTPLDPGYIKGYPPGLRENGGQYSHAAMWAILAYAKRGDAESAIELFALLNPINHARTPDEVERYKVEPYVIAADVYSVAPHVGRGGWTWYTGAAGWMYRAGIEGILGLRREGEHLVVDPCIPDAWPEFEVAVDVASTRYRIQVTNRSKNSSDLRRAVLDGAALDCAQGLVRVSLDGGSHRLQIHC